MLMLSYNLIYIWKCTAGAMFFPPPPPPKITNMHFPAISAYKSTCKYLKFLEKVPVSTKKYLQVPNDFSTQNSSYSTHFLFFVQLLKVNRLTSIKLLYIEKVPLKSTCKYPGVPASTWTTYVPKIRRISSTFNAFSIFRPIT